MSAEDNSELIEQARAELRRIQDRQGANEETLNQLHDAAAVVTSGDGTVTVEMSSEGTVTQVSLHDSALRAGAAQLSHSITETIRRATAIAAESFASPQSTPAPTRPADTRPVGSDSEPEDDDAVFSGIFDP